MTLRVRRLWIQMTSDPRRFGALCGCMLLGLLLWARIIIVSNMPRTAVANEAQNPGASGNDPGSTAAVSGSAKSPRSTITIDLATAPDHDPFVISQTYFPKPTGSATSSSHLSDPGKSPQEPVEDAQQIEARRTAYLGAAVSKLKLDAAMQGTMAVISGKSFRLGESVKGPGNEQVGFTLVEVGQRSIVLECEGRRFELKMATPGRD
jgi:hypothetical protein